MTPYVLAEGIITEDLLDVRDVAEGFMADLPDPEPGAPACHTIQRGDTPKTYWSCHGLVRAFARMYPDWQVLDGYFGPMKHQHSWLYRFTDHDGGVIILDLYPVAGCMPMIVDASARSPWRAIYVESSLAYRPNQRLMWEAEADYALKLYHEAAGAAQEPPPPPPEPDDTVVVFPASPVAPAVAEPPPEEPQAFTRPMVADLPPPMRETFVPVPERQTPTAGAPMPPPKPTFRDANPAPKVERQGFRLRSMRSIIEGAQELMRQG